MNWRDRMVAQERFAAVVLEATVSSSNSVDANFSSCYEQLSRIARKYLGTERQNHTLQSKDLVHEAYLRLVHGTGLNFENPAKFFVLAARSMRRVLVDYARGRNSARRGGGALRLSLSDAASVVGPPAHVDFIDLDQALTALEREIPEKARVLELRFYAGMTHEEISTVLGISLRTVKRYAAYAQARLYEIMRE